MEKVSTRTKTIIEEVNNKELDKKLMDLFNNPEKYAVDEPRYKWGTTYITIVDEKK